VQLTERTFDPRFPIELAKGGSYFSATSFRSGPRASSSKSASGLSFGAPGRRTNASPFGITYTVQCPYCSKRFKRNTFDTSLNPHKDRYGNPC
jgi:hypothetical protein